MKRRQFLKAAGVGLAASTAVAAPAIAQSMPTIKWRMPTSWPKSLDTLYGGAEMMCKAVGEATDGKFQIQPFAGGEIVPGLQVVDAVQNGTVEIGHTASYYYFGKDPTFAFGTSVAFGPNQRLNQGWFTLGGGKEVLNEFYKKYNWIALLAGNTGCQMGGWFRKEINTVDDLKGLKMRIGGFPRPRAAKARRGAAADRGRRHLSGAGEGHHRRRRMGRSLRRREARLLQGRAALLLSRLVGRRLDAVAFVNLDKWNALPKHYQAVLEQAGHFANTWMMAKYDEVNPPALRRLLAGGAKLHGFSPAIMEACFKAAKELHSEIAGTNESFKKVYDSMTNYTNNGYQWFQVAEFGYDSFMVRHSRG